MSGTDPAAYTSPVAGQRYRLSYSPTIGNISFQTLLADYRRYFFMRPMTFAVRGLSYGRYGKDSESGRISPLYLGEETLLRGYGFGSITNEECIVGQTQQSTCPVFDRMLGSRLAVFNAELRIPLFGGSEFGLLNFPFLPTEIAPFLDGGVAYTGSQAPDFRFSTNPTDAAQRVSANCQNQAPSTQTSFGIVCTDRIPVFSTGVSARVNFLGYMIFEAYHTARKRVMGEPVDEFSSLVNVRPGGRGFPTGAVTLIVLGVILLLNTLDILQFRYIARYWPVVLILAGVYMLWGRLAAADAVPGQEARHGQE